MAFGIRSRRSADAVRLGAVTRINHTGSDNASMQSCPKGGAPGIWVPRRALSVCGPAAIHRNDGTGYGFGIVGCQKRC